MKNKEFWKTVIQIIVTVLTALNYAGRERLRYVEAYPQPLPERRGAWRGERERSEPQGSLLLLYQMVISPLP